MVRRLNKIINLVEQEFVFKSIVDTDKNYRKSTTASAHANYHITLYWYKLALIAQKRGIASRDQDQLVRFVQGYSSAVIVA